MESLDAVRKILSHRNRNDLARLLAHAYIEFDVSSTYGSLLFSQLTSAEIYAPLSDYDHLRALSQEDSLQIFDVVLEIWPPKEYGMEITSVCFRLDSESLSDTSDSTEEILHDLDNLRNIMVAVSTGGPRIKEVNSEYKEGYSQLTKRLKERGLQNPIPYSDLWDWYGKWSSGDLPTYQSRREYISDLFKPLETRLRESPASRSAEVFQEPTGWPRIDRSLDQARSQLEYASSEEQFQAVGLYCRETLISLAQTVFDLDNHPPINGVKPSKTDAKRMLDSYLASEVSGSSNAVVRKHAKASLDLANELQHQRTATFRQAALCAEATASVVNIVAILSGRRDAENGILAQPGQVNQY